MTEDAYRRTLKNAIGLRFDGARQADATANAIIHFARAIGQDYLEHYGERPPLEVIGVMFLANGTTEITTRPTTAAANVRGQVSEGADEVPHALA